LRIKAIPIPNNITTFFENVQNQNILRQLLIKSNITVEGKLKLKEEKAKEEADAEGKGMQ